MRPSFRIQLLLGYVALVLFVEGTTLAVLNYAFESDLVSSFDRRLQAQANGAARWVAQGGKHPNNLAARLGKVLEAHVTIFDAHGEVLGDSKRVGGQRSVPELKAALSGQTGWSTRFSAPLGARMRYVAVPSSSDRVVRLGVPLSELSEPLARLRQTLLGIGAVAFAIALFLSFWVARFSLRPLRAMERVAGRIARGDYRVRGVDAPKDEFDSLQNSLASMASQLDRQETVRKDFVANVSHELRTPLAAIQASTETLMRTETSREEQKEFLQMMGRHASRMGHLVQDLLHLSELEAKGSEVPDAAPVTLRNLLAGVKQTFAKAADLAGMEIRVQCDEHLVLVTNPQALEQAVENLVSNAIRYGSGGGEVTLVGEQIDEGGVLIEVADQGAGISEEHLPRIFERFYRVDTGRSREQGGTGLGLAIVKRLVTSLKGEITVASREQEGTRFRIVLPSENAPG